MLLGGLKLEGYEEAEATISEENAEIIAEGAEIGYLRKVKSNKIK